MRKNAAESLGEFASAAAKSVPALLERIKDDSVEVRRQAILSLGRIGKGNAKVEEALKEHSKDEDSLTRLNAIIGLTAMGKTDDSVIPTLVEAMESKEKATAKQAARTLANIAQKTPEKVLPKMMDALETADESMRSNTLRVLRGMKGKAAPALPKMAALYDKVAPSTRVKILETAATVDADGDVAIPLLDKGLRAQDPLDRNKALIELLKYRNKTDIFMEKLKIALHDKDAENRFLALRVVVGQGERGLKLLPELLTLTKDPELRIRRQATRIVSSFREPPPEVIVALGESLKDKDFRIRMATVTALANLARARPNEAAALLEEALKTEKHERTKRMMTTTLQRIRVLHSSGARVSTPAPKPKAAIDPEKRPGEAIH